MIWASTRLGVDTRDGRLREDHLPLAHCPDVAPEAEALEVVEEALLEELEGFEVGEILAREMKGLEVSKQGFQSREDRIAAPEGIVPEEDVEDGGDVLARASNSPGPS